MPPEGSDQTKKRHKSEGQKATDQSNDERPRSPIRLPPPQTGTDAPPPLKAKAIPVRRKEEGGPRPPPPPLNAEREDGPSLAEAAAPPPKGRAHRLEDALPLPRRGPALTEFYKPRPEEFTLRQPFTNWYFAFGSNMSRTQMKGRCPTAVFRGVGRLPGYVFFVNQRGYCNVVGTGENGRQGERGEVWGLVFALTPPDEQSLDIYEGVGYYKDMSQQKKTELGIDTSRWPRPDDIYSKEMIGVDFWPVGGTGPKANIKDDNPGTMIKAKMLVYVDHNEITDGTVDPRYAARLVSRRESSGPSFSSRSLHGNCSKSRSWGYKEGVFRATMSNTRSDPLFQKNRGSNV